MSGLRLLALGVGDAFSALNYSASFALECQGRWLLIDCPHPIRKMLREASAQAGFALDLPQIDGVVLTHLHADHASGLEGMGFYYRFLLHRRAPLLAHPSVSADMWPHSLSAGMEWADQPEGGPPAHREVTEFFDLQPLAEDRPRVIGPFTVHCRRTLHTIPTYALRVEAGGRCLGYSADTAFDPTLIDWLAPADLIVHEVSGGFMHTDYESLAALPEATRGKLRLIHYPDEFDLAACRLEPIRQGRVYEI